MRRRYWLAASLMVLVVSMGCGCSVFKPERTVVRDAEAGQALENQVIVEPEAETPVVKVSGDQASTVSTPASGEVADSGTIGKDQSTVETASDTVPSLITKSENAVTESERIELFNTLGFELDELIRLLDSLDTVQESDLNLDEFEE